MTLEFVLAILLAQATASPIPTSTPVALYVIRPPEGWQQMPPPSAQNDRVQLLSLSLGPVVNGFRTGINVIRDQLTDPTETIEARSKESVMYISTHSDGKPIASHAQRVCNASRDGWLIDSTGTYDDRKVELVQTLVLDAGYEYVATYTRPINTAADPAAVAALDTLCPVSA